MSIEEEISKHTNGAQFHRADLHVHSFGEFGSYDVKDTTITPEAIVDTAIVEGLRVIAITDHNQIGNIRRALTHTLAKDLLVVPGVELSTPQGHLLMYFGAIDNLEAFYGKLDISSDKKQCRNTMLQCLKFADDYSGFGIAAHIDRDSGLEKAYTKYDAFKQDILNAPNLLALEIADIESINWYSHLDSNTNRRNCIKLRCTSLGLEEDVEIAKVMASDSHTLTALGKNVQGRRKLTRLKMDTLTFDSLRIALLDCAARVRLEDLIPATIPHFIGMKLEGGFLKDQVVRFSKNLTCIIGGRGAGKSTMLESLRVVSGNSVSTSLVDSGVWPDSISLIYEDEVGQRHALTRNKLNDVVNETDPENGPTRLSIESYGQGETAETIQHCDKDPSILLAFLDGFVDLTEMKNQDEALRESLLENQGEIERYQININRIPEIENAKAVADSQVAVLKRQNASQVVVLEEKLANERQFREQLRINLNSLLGSIDEIMVGDDLKSLMAELDGSTLAVGKNEFEAVKTLVNDLADQVSRHTDELKKKISESAEKLKEQLKSWVTKEQETQTKIEDLRRELERQNIKLDIAFIRKVTKDASDFSHKLTELNKSVPAQQGAFKVRRALLSQRRELNSKRFTTRQAFATTMNQNLSSTVVDYKVTLKFGEGILSEELEELIKSEMEWRTSQVPKAYLIASQLSPISLLDDINKKDSKRLARVVDNENNQIFSEKDALEIITRLGKWKSKAAIERCPFEDRPEILVSKTIVKPDGTKVFPVRKFSQLSLGQQQSILLSILLFSKSNAPLIIDQPEDNLDSEFIYKTLVRTLRKIKEQRQVIIVTHNANIAVLGDAELIIPLRGASDLAVIRDRGSIDTTATKKIVCTILEGSEKAFMRRQAVYGF